MKKLRAVFAFVLMGAMIAACGDNKEEVIDTKELARQDSMALHVAVFPSEGCLPLYYAEKEGIFDSLGVDIRLMRLGTMEDCDTALVNHRAEVVISDVARLLCMRKDGFRATAIAQIKVRQQLLTAKGKRITTIKQLKERIVAMTRHSELDYYSDAMLQGSGLEHLDVFRSQFNNHLMRMKMLNSALVDAAFLDEPFATLAIEEGAKRIWTNDSTEQYWMSMAIDTKLCNDIYRSKQITLLLEGYNKAVEAINNKANIVVLDSLLKFDYKFEHIAVDTLQQLKPVHLNPLTAMPEESMKKAKEWLTERGWITKSLKTDSLITDQYFAK